MKIKYKKKKFLELEFMKLEFLDGNWVFPWTQVPCEVLEFMELEFLEKIQVELELKFQNIFFFLSPRSL